MASIQLFLLLSVLTYSTTAATNLEVSTALKAFQETLKNQLDSLNIKIDTQLESVNAQLAALTSQLAAQDANLNILQDLLLESIDVTCNPGSCNITVPQPQPETSTVAYDPVEVTTAAPREVSSTPAPVGCGLNDKSMYAVHMNQTCTHLVIKNSVGKSKDEKFQEQRECQLADHDVNGTEGCITALTTDAKIGVQGCINKKVGVCSCTLDTTRTSDVQAVVDILKYVTVGYKSIDAVWADDTPTRAFANGTVYGKVGFLKYNWRG